MNAYGDINECKARLGIPAATTTYDKLLRRLLESASRTIDGYCHRSFFIANGTRYFDASEGKQLIIDDALGITTVAMDSELDGTYDGETWTDGTDFVAVPRNSVPKIALQALPWGSYSFIDQELYAKVVGVWGYGTGESTAPYSVSGVTVTTTDSTTTSATASSGATLYPGHTVLVDSEQIYITAATSTGGLTVERACNGTTGAAHASAAAYLYDYPMPVCNMTYYLAGMEYQRQRHAGFQSESIGEYSYTISRDAADMAYGSQMAQCLGPYRRLDLP